MTRDAFLTRLREGLNGLPPSAVNDIVSDYEAHFAEAQAAGRADEEVAKALGDPARLARELRAEASLKRWETERNPSGAAGAVFAVLGLATIDILILLPILLSVAGTLFGFFVANIAIFGAGGFVLAAGPFMDLPGGPLASVLCGVGLMAGAASMGALLTLITIGLVNALVWYGRLHYRLLTPAIQS